VFEKMENTLSSSHERILREPLKKIEINSKQVEQKNYWNKKKNTVQRKTIKRGK